MGRDTFRICAYAMDRDRTCSSNRLLHLAPSPFLHLIVLPPTGGRLILRGKLESTQGFTCPLLKNCSGKCHEYFSDHSCSTLWLFKSPSSGQCPPYVLFLVTNYLVQHRATRPPSFLHLPAFSPAFIFLVFEIFSTVASPPSPSGLMTW